MAKKITHRYSFFEEFENMMICGQCDQDNFHDNYFHIKLFDSDPSIHSPIQEI